jgi:hypothetical protein
VTCIAAHRTNFKHTQAVGLATSKLSSASPPNSLTLRFPTALTTDLWQVVRACSVACCSCAEAARLQLVLLVP